MAKRTATTELNHDNWEEEDEPETAGEFTRAPEAELKRRVIKTARRRNPLAATAGESKPSAFSSFQGFGKTTSTAPAAPNFSFLNNLASTPKLNGTSETPKPISTAMFGSANTGVSTEKKQVSSKDDEYLAKLKGLNESVSKWISKHVSENPLINLEPVFKDYSKFFEELEKNKSQAKQTGNDEKKEEPAAPKPTFTFGTAQSISTTSSSLFGSPAAAKPTFSFGSANNAPKTTQSESANFSFASTVSNTSSTGFGFSSSTSFGFGAKPAEKPAETAKNGEEDDEDEPPKVEYNPVMEEDHIFTTKCKLFIKKDDKFGAGSVSNLFLKKVADSDKVQMIVRADTNLGNILCNLILSESIPTKRLGNKDVMLICLPLPDSKPPPTTILLRVKSGDDADKLLETLEKHKK